MSTPLGYGEGSQFQITGVNLATSSGNDISKGHCVQISGATTSPNTGETVPGVIRVAGADSDDVLGIATKDMSKSPTTTAGEGGYGHIAILGIIKALVKKSSTDIAVGDPLYTAADGTLTEAGSTNKVAIALEAQTSTTAALKSVFIDRAAGSAGGA